MDPISETSILDVILRHSAEFGDRVAVQCGALALSYGRLEEFSGQLADQLRTSGVAAETPVGVCLAPGIDLIVALLGVMRAGGAYVPLDPEHPPERLKQLAAIANVTKVITSPDIWSTSPAVERSLVISEGACDAVAEPAMGTPTRNIEPNQLAYAMFTSGSTGEPKGVLIEHRNLAYSTLVRFVVYPDPVDAFLLVPSFSSDSSAAGIYWTLCAGGRLVIVSSTDRRDPIALARAIRAERITHVLLSPLLYGAVLEVSTPEDLCSLRTAIVAGEKCPGVIATRHARQLPKAKLFNEYGPTEASVWCSVYECRAEEEGTLPLGGPLPGLTLSAMNHQTSEYGTEGELHVGGPGVGRGYLNAASLTADRFRPDPAGSAYGGRVYCTGDLVQVAADGVIHFKGRADRQVKIGANRIELEEIERTLHHHPAIGGAHVTVEGSPEGVPMLLAYCISDPDRDPNLKRSLRSWLNARLPAFMVPHQFVFLSRFPLTVNGKIDSAALREQRPRTFVARRDAVTATEATLISIWETLLNVQGVRPTDRFVDLGGDSMRAIRLQTEVCRVFDKRVPLAALLKAERICDQARLLSTTRRFSHTTRPRIK